MPGRARARRQRRAAQRGRLRVLGHEELGRLDAVERRGEVRRGNVGQREPPRGEVEPRDARALAGGDARGQQAGRARVEQVRVDQRARRHDPRDAPLDRPLARRRIADLLDDHRRLAQPHEPREVLLDRVERDAGHRDRRARGLAARCERDVEEPGRALRVVVEELVEVAHPVEDELVRVLRLDAQVLLHHRRVRRERVGGREHARRHRRGVAVGRERDLSALRARAIRRRGRRRAGCLRRDVPPAARSRRAARGA